MGGVASIGTTSCCSILLLQHRQSTQGMVTLKETQKWWENHTHLHVLIASSGTRHSILLLLLLLLLLHHIIRVHGHRVHADHPRMRLGVPVPAKCEHSQQQLSRPRINSTYMGAIPIAAPPQLLRIIFS